jgi:hypothetical protein
MPAETEKRERLRDDVREVEPRGGQVGQLCGAEVTSGEARLFDDDGIGQALFRSHFLTSNCTPRTSERIGTRAALG